MIVLGIGTDVGKTVASAVLTAGLKGDYWKPIQCGESDSETVFRLVGTKAGKIYPPAYHFKNPLSPHHAARLEHRSIDVQSLHPPATDRPLVIETTAGVMAPLTLHEFSIDICRHWEFKRILVSRHYLGSINHTLLTLHFLKQRQIPLFGIIFNGEPYPEAEEVILHHAQIPLLGRLYPEPEMTPAVIDKYVQIWRPETWI